MLCANVFLVGLAMGTRAHNVYMATHMLRTAMQVHAQTVICVTEMENQWGHNVRLGQIQFALVKYKSPPQSLRALQRYSGK